MSCAQKSHSLSGSKPRQNLDSLLRLQCCFHYLKGKITDSWIETVPYRCLMHSLWTRISPPSPSVPASSFTALCSPLLTTPVPPSRASSGSQRAGGGLDVWEAECEGQKWREGNSDRASKGELGRNKETETRKETKHKCREVCPRDSDTDYRRLDPL